MLFFTGCITVEEHYNFKKNGSGTMEYVIDMSSMVEMMEALGAMKDENGDPIGGDDNGPDLTKDVDGLKEIPGISKVKLSEKDMVSRIRYRFENLEALNKALNVIMPDTTGAYHQFFVKENGQLKKTYNNRSDMSSKLGNDSEEDDTADFLEQMKYKVTLRGTPKMKVNGFGEEVMVTQENKKQVLMETNFRAIAEDPDALSITIDMSK